MKRKNASILTVSVIAALAMLTLAPIVPGGYVHAPCYCRNTACMCSHARYPIWGSITYRALGFGGFYVDGNYTVTSR